MSKSYIQNSEVELEGEEEEAVVDFDDDLITFELYDTFLEEEVVLSESLGRVC
jgi:hypothetical protein